MIREDIIRMAREAGFMLRAESVQGQSDWWECFDEAIEKLVALVAAASEAKEREECAKVCEAGVDYEHPTVKGHIMENFGHSRLLAKAIRARGAASIRGQA